MGPPAVIEQVTASKLVGRGGAAFPAGRKWNAVAAAAGPEVRDCQRGRVRARHVQGPRPPRARSVRCDRGDGDRGVGRRGRAWLRVRARRVSRGPAPVTDAAIDRRAGPACSAATCCTSAAVVRDRAPAGRGRLHLRRGDRAVQLDRGPPGKPRVKPPFPGGSACSAADAVQQRRDAGQRAAHPARPPRRDPEWTDNTKLFSVAGNVARPGVYEVPNRKTRCASCLDLAGGVAGNGRVWCGWCCSAARRGRSWAPSTLDVIPHRRGHPRDRRDARLRRGDRARRQHRSRRPWCCGSRRSSVTSRAGSACPAASEPYVRRRPLPPPRERDGRWVCARGELARLHDVGNVMRDASICGLGQTACPGTWSKSVLVAFGVVPAGTGAGIASERSPRNRKSR